MSSLPLLAIRCFGFLLLVSVGCYAVADDSSKGLSRIVKWKDENGVTHYGDKIPPQYANRENSLMNKQGVTVQHNKPLNMQDHAADAAKLEQDKKDKALLGAFTNASEIDLARDRNVQLDLIALDNLNQEKLTAQKKLSTNQALANNYTKRKKTVPENISNDIADNKSSIAKIDEQIISRKQVIEDTRKRFDEDKKRFLLIKNHSGDAPNDAPQAANPVQNPTTAPNKQPPI